MTQELILNTGIFESSQNSLHEVIFNRFDTPHVNNGKTFTYDPEEFKAVLPLFKEVPLVFAKTHPLNIGKIPLEDALNEVDGRLAGTPQDVLVNQNNTLFRGSVNVTDPEANELISQGKAMLSTSFLATPDENGVLRDLSPNHILIYPSETGIPPGDHAALFLNQSGKNGQDTMAEDNKNETMELQREVIQNQNVIQTQTAQISEQKELILNQKKELEEKDRVLAQKDDLLKQREEMITNQTSAIDELNKKVTELANVIEDNKKAEKNKRRERIFNQYLPGVLKQFETRKEEIFDDEKYEDLIFEMNQAQLGAGQPPTQKSGTEVVTNQEEPVSAGVSIQKDPATGKMVSKVIYKEA